MNTHTHVDRNMHTHTFFTYVHTVGKTSTTGDLGGVINVPMKTCVVLYICVYMYILTYAAAYRLTWAKKCTSVYTHRYT